MPRFQDELSAARRAGAQAELHEPRATHVAYDWRSRKIVLELRDGQHVEVLVEDIEGVAGANERAQAHIELVGYGEGVRWPVLDVDSSVPGLVEGRFGCPVWMRKVKSRHGA